MLSLYDLCPICDPSLKGHNDVKRALSLFLSFSGNGVIVAAGPTEGCANGTLMNDHDLLIAPDKGAKSNSGSTLPIDGMQMMGDRAEGTYYR